MKVILDIPDYVQLSYSEYDLKMFVAMSLYEKNIIDTGALAEAVGISRADFILEMGRYGKTIFDNTEEEYEKDMMNAGKFIQ